MELNRRSLVKTAAVAGGAAVLAGMGAASAQAYEAAPWMPEAWGRLRPTRSLIGYGAAGSAAANDLADRGFTSLLIEKMDKEYAGGDCSICGGYLTDGGFTPEGYQVSALAGVDTAYAEAVVPVLNDACSYLVGLGVPLQDGIPVVASENGEPFGQVLYHVLEAAVEERADKITVMYETPGIGLVQDPVTGEVLGVVAGSKEAPIYLKANRGVVVASGSYEADLEMTNRIHMPGVLFPTIGSPANTGDGLKMLMKAGCKAQNFGKRLEYACTWAPSRAAKRSAPVSRSPTACPPTARSSANCAGRALR